jgi:6-phosphogluconate dehydrogenase/gluconokinase
MIIIVCGVSGTGKSTVGKLLAEELQLPFFDGDDFHSTSNLQKMKKGFALNDEDRLPWLELLAKALASWENNDGAVLACSALKEAYRQILALKCQHDIKWVMLHGSTELLTKRLESRKEHFFNAQLLHSQLDTLELPDYGWLIDVRRTPEMIVNDVYQRLSEK